MQRFSRGFRPFSHTHWRINLPLQCQKKVNADAGSDPAPAERMNSARWELRAAPGATRLGADGAATPQVAGTSSPSARPRGSAEGDPDNGRSPAQIRPRVEQLAGAVEHSRHGNGADRWRLCAGEPRVIFVNSRTGKITGAGTQDPADTTVTVDMNEYLAGRHPALEPRHGDTYIFVGTPVAAFWPTAHAERTARTESASLLQRVNELEVSADQLRQEMLRPGAPSARPAGHGVLD